MIVQLFTDRGDAEIWSTAVSLRSSRTSVWPQQASHRALSPGEAFPRDRLPDTVSPVNYWEEYDQSKDQDVIAIYIRSLY